MGGTGDGIFFQSLLCASRVSSSVLVESVSHLRWQRRWKHRGLRSKARPRLLGCSAIAILVRPVVAVHLPFDSGCGVCFLLHFCCSSIFASCRLMQQLTRDASLKVSSCYVAGSSITQSRSCSWCNNAMLPQ